MKGKGEFRTHVHVARVTELRRLSLHQELAFLRVMGRVTIGATDAVRKMHRTVVVAMFLRVLMAPQTAPAPFLWGRILEREDLGFIASTIDVLFPRPVTRFTPVPLRSFPLF